MTKINHFVIMYNETKLRLRVHSVMCVSRVNEPV